MEANLFIFRLNNKMFMFVSISMQCLYKKHFHDRWRRAPTDIFCTPGPWWWGSHESNTSLSHITNPALPQLPEVTDLHFSAKILPHTGSLGTRGADRDCTKLVYCTYWRVPFSFYGRAFKMLFDSYCINIILLFWHIKALIVCILLYERKPKYKSLSMPLHF